MIEVDSKAIEQYVYFPASIKSEVNQYSLEIHSELSQVTNTYTGLTDESNSRTYFKFLLDLIQEDDGEKNYTIKDELEHVVATGLIRIGAIEDEMPEEVSYVPEEEIEIIQYNPNNKFKYRFQTNKQVTVTSNDVYVIKPDLGYDAMLKATVEVNVPVQDYYNSGYTSGYTDGVEEQKSKLVSTAVTENGVYTRVDGYLSIDVNVPSGSTINNQTKNVTYTANTATTITFDSGYTGLQQVGINVNVAQTGYTQEDLNNAFSNGFNSGFTSGQTVGYNSGYTAGYASGSTDGYDAGYIAGYADGYEDGSHDYSKEYLTITSLSGGSIVFKDIYSNSPISISYSINGGEWQTLTSSQSGTPLAVQANDVVRLKASNSTYNNHYLQVTSAATISGNIMSLVYGDDFQNQTTLTTNDVFHGLFHGGNYTDASHLILPATTLTSGCYMDLFSTCYLLVKAPKILPATVLTQNCYFAMFQNCEALKSVPELPATTLAESCYTSMFNDCRKLTTAPELPATTLAPYCYASMFANCTGLTSAPELPATTLAYYCYHEMFKFCTGLTSAPELPATTLTFACYQGMFSYCSSLNKITCLATDISAMDATNNWVNGVSSVGTFTKDENMASWTTGNNGIPSGWTINNYEHDYSTDYLTFDIISGGTLTIPYNDDNYSYSLNGGEWVTVSGSGYSISVNDGDKVRFKNKRVLFTGDSNFSGNTVVYNVYGNIMSLLYGDDFIGETTLPNKNDLFYKLFAGTNVVNAEHLILPATTLKSNCYNWMFHSCRSLITAPDLPATTLATKCYFGMFDYCTSLTTAPELPAETLTSQCYSGMFEGCSNLSYIKCLATDISANNCIYEWVLSVKSNGTFIKKSGTTWPTGISGIPNKWTVQEV